MNARILLVAVGLAVALSASSAAPAPMSMSHLFGQVKQVVQKAVDHLPMDKIKACLHQQHVGSAVVSIVVQCATRGGGSSGISKCAQMKGGHQALDVGHKVASCLAKHSAPRQ